ncbi:FAD synthase [uncultured archaeon]|nr:FAD synthase [uncultured archaeon]
MLLVNNPEAFSSGKIVELNEAAVFASKLKSFGKKVGLCHGCFDLLHPGHVIHLESAKRLCDYLIVSLTADKFIRLRKGSGRPIFSETLRAYMVASLESVDCVIISDYEKGTEVIELIKPSCYIKGPDIINLDTPAINEEREMIKKVGGEIIYTADQKLATTEIVNYIKSFQND